MKFVPYQQLGETANLIVDGTANEHTVLTLSHWANSGTPKDLAADLSAQIVFRYLDRPDLHVHSEAVSNNHFDEDGLAGTYSVLNPQHALKHRELLIDIASAGDFGTYKHKQAAQAVFVLSAYTDRNRSPLPREIFDLPYPDMASALYEQILPVLPTLLEDPEQYRKWWHEEDHFLDVSNQAIADGTISIEEKSDLDLAIVRIPAELKQEVAHRFTRPRDSACHPFAINNQTDRFRVLLIKGNEYELQFRYETWVQYISRPPLLRVDLQPLAKRLTKLELNGAIWEFDGVQQLTPTLRVVNSKQSTFSPAEFIGKVEEFLPTASPAWNPYEDQIANH